MHTLHTRTAQIYRWWAEENAETELTSLWIQGWCPLLQGIARLCCDSRRQVVNINFTNLPIICSSNNLTSLYCTGFVHV